MKVTKKKMRYILLHKKKGESSDTIGKDMKISKRRVNQLWEEYNKTWKEPIIGNNLGRPKKPISLEESELIKKAFHRFKFGVSTAVKNSPLDNSGQKSQDCRPCWK